jgi:hypothetical protein
VGQYRDEHQNNVEVSDKGEVRKRRGREHEIYKEKESTIDMKLCMVLERERQDER